MAPVQPELCGWRNYLWIPPVPGLAAQLRQLGLFTEDPSGRYQNITQSLCLQDTVFSSEKFVLAMLVGAREVKASRPLPAGHCSKGAKPAAPKSEKVRGKERELGSNPSRNSGEEQAGWYSGRWIRNSSRVTWVLRCQAAAGSGNSSG